MIYKKTKKNKIEKSLILCFKILLNICLSDKKINS